MSAKKIGWFTVRNGQSAGEPTEILIYDSIGADPWDSSGVNAKDFAATLNSIPKDQPINLRINCPGGNVWDGLAIRAQLQERRSQVTCIVDGLAASVGSWLALSGKETRMAKSAMMMIHEPSSICAGDSDQMRKMANELDAHADVIAQMYADKSGKSKAHFRNLMAEETWFSADEAKKAGLCDSVVDLPPVTNSFNLSGFRRVPETLKHNAPRNSAAEAANTKPDIMKEKLLALLKQRGLTAPENATEEQMLDLLAKPAAPENVVSKDEFEKMRSELKAEQEARAAERSKRFDNVLNQCVTEGRIGANDKAAWLKRVEKDETLLEVVQNMKPATIEEPLGTVELKSESIKDIENHILKSLSGPQNSIARTVFVRKMAERLAPVLNTNTISSDLKRVAILDDMLRAFVKILTNLKAFSTVHLNVPLQGTDEVVVPFYDLETAASTSFNGTYSLGNTTTDARKVTINNRKYQGMAWTSSDFRRQPYLNIQQLGVLKAQKLAYDVWTDILSVITAANYTISPVVRAAANVDLAWSAEVRAACNANQWPEVGRTLIVNNDYDQYLQQDTSFRMAFALAENIVKEGKIPRLAGFDYMHNPNFPTNSENLAGIAAFVSSILVATAPIEPTQEVRSVMTSYDVVTDPQTGIGFEVRSWGAPTTDTSNWVIECNYGYAKGNANAIVRLTTA